MELDNIPIIDITPENIDKEHICCAINEKKGETCVKDKKDWLKARFKEGLMFKRLDARGKFFIEYIPAENAWAPVTAPNYMYINCFWVSGKYKGHGHAGRLLDECIKDAKAKGKSGLVILSAKKKEVFLIDGKFLKYKGFKIADTANPNYELLYFPFSDNEENIPKFNKSIREPDVEKEGFVQYFSNQCPFAEKYTKLLKEFAVGKGYKFDLVKITTREQAQNSPCPFATGSLFYNGKLLTHEILTDKRFMKVMEKEESLHKDIF